MAHENDSIAGRLAVERGYLSQAQLDDALETQRQALDQMGMDMPLLQVLVTKGLLTPEQEQDVRKAVAVETGKVLQVGDYEVTEKIGQGGFGAVFKAKSVVTGETVALKILLPARATPDLIKRFEREAKIVATLDHKHIVRCIEFGHDPDKNCHFCALEYVDGEDLYEHVKRVGVLPEAEALSITYQITKALQHAHWSALIHRDVKPDNIMVMPDGTAKLLDLGLARPMDEEMTRLTQSGDVFGSPHYMSPEQAKSSKDVDTRADIYSLGATVYFMVTGRPPFDGATALMIIQQHVYGKLAWPAEANPALSNGICRMIAKMMVKDPGGRYQKPMDLLRDIDTLKAGGEPDIGDVALRKSTIAVPARPRRRRKRPDSGPRHARARESASADHGGPNEHLGAPSGKAMSPKAKRWTLIGTGLATGVLAAGLITLFSGGEPKPRAPVLQPSGSRGPSTKPEEPEEPADSGAEHKEAEPPPKPGLPDIPEDALMFAGHRYKLYEQRMDWHEAKAFCERAGGHLVTITSREENDFVTALARAAGLEAWIGLSDERHKGKWEWVTQEGLFFTGWAPGKPSSQPYRRYGSLSQWQHHDCRWDDRGNGPLSFVCEWKSTGPHRPTILGRSIDHAFAGRAYSYSVSAVGRPRPTIEVSSLPEWLAFDGTRTVSGTPPRAASSKRFVFNVAAINDDNQERDEREVTLAVFAEGEPGLLGQYYRGTGLNPASLALSRIDQQIGHKGGRPAPGLSAERFSVRWTGEIHVPASGSYGFRTVRDDGLRLCIDAKSIIDKWTDADAAENVRFLDLQAGWLPICVEYYQGRGRGRLSLEWFGPGFRLRSLGSAGELRTAVADARATTKASTSAAADLTRGLVGWWKLDEGEGAVARDSSGKGNDGRLSGNPKWTTGHAGGALEFDGAGDHVAAMDSSGITGTSPRSVSAWVRTLDQEAPIASWGADRIGEKYVFRVQDTDGVPGAIRVEVHDGWIVGTTVVADGRWHHVAVVYPPGSTDVLHHMLYVDGRLESLSAADAQQMNTADGGRILIAADEQERRLRGSIDDVRVYDRALSPAEVALLAAPSAPPATEQERVPEPVRSAPTSAGHRVDTGALLSEFDTLVGKGDFAAAREAMQRAAAQAADAEDVDIPDTFRAAARVAAALEDRMEKVRLKARSLVDVGMKLMIAKEELDGTLVSVTDSGLSLTVKMRMPGGGEAEMPRSVKWSELTPTLMDSFASEWLPAGADGHVARGIVLLLRGSRAAADKAFEAADDHLLADYAAGRAARARTAAAEKAAKAAWRKIERAAVGELEADTARALATRIAAFQTEHGDTGVAKSVAEELAALRQSVARALPPTAGCYGFRGGGGRRRAALRGGASRKSEASVDAGLRWLANNQEPDGSWSIAKWDGSIDWGDTGVTGLALLAFLGAGHTEKTGKFKNNVLKAVDYLIGKQNAHGAIGSGAGYWGYNHSIAGLSIAEAFGMARVQRTGVAAQKAVNWSIDHHQASYSGWRYSPKQSPDTSVTGWFIMQLKSAKIAGLRVDGKGFQGAIAWLDKVTDMPGQGGAQHGCGRARYTVGGNPTVSMTSIAMLSRQVMGWKLTDPLLTGGADYLVENLPRWGNGVWMYYYWYWGSLAMFQMGGDWWEQWNASLRDMLVGKQINAPGNVRLDGSWEPIADGEQAGRAYSTAMACLCLEVYYRYMPLYKNR
jgi:serine/threonine protein kinase